MQSGLLSTHCLTAPIAMVDVVVVVAVVVAVEVVAVVVAVEVVAVVITAVTIVVVAVFFYYSDGGSVYLSKCEDKRRISDA